MQLVPTRPVAKTDPAPTAVFSIYPTSIPVDPRKTLLTVQLPSASETSSTGGEIASGTLVRQPEASKTDSNTFTIFDTAVLIEYISARGSWVFLARDYADITTSPANYAAQSVAELRHIQYLIENTIQTHWYIDVGLGCNSSFHPVTSSNIDLLIADFQAVYGDVDKPQYYVPANPTTT